MNKPQARETERQDSFPWDEMKKGVESNGLLSSEKPDEKIGAKATD